MSLDPGGNVAGQGGNTFVSKLNDVKTSIGASKNNTYLAELFKSIDACVQVYNSGIQKTKPVALDDVMVKAAMWLTSKQPKRGADHVKNPARWNAMTRLAQLVAVESEVLGVKMLHSPADFREIKGDKTLHRHSYWLEKVDPIHRPGYELSVLYEEWLGEPISQSFWHYVANSAKNPATQVTYFSSDARNTYKVTWNDGQKKAYINNGIDLLDTAGNVTVHGGKGWAIFVSGAFHMYSCNHEMGKMHHSTIFHGLPVVGAGEVVAEDGIVKLISAKSGHYRPTVADMRRMVQALAWIADDCLILPLFTDVNIPCYRVGSFRAQGEAAPLVTKDEFLQWKPKFLDTSSGKRAAFVSPLAKIVNNLRT
jgi:hypothetical protein